MSTTAANPTPPQTPAQPPVAPAPLSGDAAYDAVYKTAYAMAWRDKLAQVYGVRARSQEEEAQFLQVTNALRHNYETERQKAASAADPALSHLQQHLGLPVVGISQAASAHGEEAYIRKAAATLSFNPQIAHAALSLLLANQPAA